MMKELILLFTNGSYRCIEMSDNETFENTQTLLKIYNEYKVVVAEYVKENLAGWSLLIKP